MSKAILVMDMPDSCRECPLELQKYQCGVNSEIMKDNTIRQDWCPLKPMPNKKEAQKLNPYEMNMIEHNQGYRKGYNACIDEILGGGE